MTKKIKKAGKELFNSKNIFCYLCGQKTISLHQRTQPIILGSEKRTNIYDIVGYLCKDCNEFTLRKDVEINKDIQKKIIKIKLKIEKGG